MILERLLGFAFAPLVLLIGIGFVYWTSPPTTLNPLCTYTSQYELRGTIKVGDEVLQSTVYRQRSMSRRWVATINYAGCQQQYGMVLSFKARDGRVFLVPTELCALAERVLLDIGKVDVLRICNAKLADKLSKQSEKYGFVVSTADNPTSWSPFELAGNGPITIVSMLATATKKWPADDLDSVAPSLLKTQFIYGSNWWHSPERFVVRGDRTTFRATKLDIGIGTGLRETIQ
ncbi:hypothetical protein HFO27_36680 [Rhizobium leguminosarum]|uniref:hypothetical protein n=1 Tax=Rhizobium leguminosarum TaxID=384 RepID=UPI001C918D27|nr:hypothetical protein [Rhizobium leguminosarum]MBY3179972.1 hypothetical protein [Rhizobium leguminosarum]